MAFASKNEHAALKHAQFVIEHARPPRGPLESTWLASRAKFVELTATIDLSRMWARLRAERIVAAPDFTAPKTSPWLWAGLRRTFPEALAACILPNTIHIVVEADRVAMVRAKLNRLLGQFARAINVPGGRAGRATALDLSTDLDALATMVRDVALAPCAAGLVRDPLSWELSTYRDLFGATVDPWVSGARLLRTIEVTKDKSLQHFHEHISDDESAIPGGSPAPSPARACELPSYPLAQIASAAASATRCPADRIRAQSVTRTLFVQLAIEQGWNNARQLANACHCSTRTILRLNAKPRAELLGPGRLCLGDPRLREQWIRPQGDP